MGRAKWLTLSGILIAIALAAGGFVLVRRAAAPKAIQTAKAADPEPPAREARLSGKIQSRHVVSVGAQVSGTVDVFLADVGQEVFEGQLLARIASQGLEAAQQEAARVAQSAQDRLNSIESRIIAAKLEASRARADANRSRDEFERADKAYQRQRMLFREGATPRLVYEKSEREFETARAEFNARDELARQAEERVSGFTQELEGAQRLLNERNAALEGAKNQSSGAEIHSPVSGVVTARKGEPGKMIGPDDAKDLFEIAVDLSQLEVSVTPEPPALARLRAGQPAMLFVAELPGAIPGTIKEIKGSDVIVEFTSPTPVIRPGMTADVVLTLE